MVGVLAAAGTPVDKSVHVSLKALLSTYRLAGWRTPKDGEAYSKEELLEMDLIPADVVALKLNNSRNSDI